MAASFRIGTDIGGTFTDFTVIDDATGEIVVEKCLTTRGAPEAAVLDGLDILATKTDALLPQTTAVIHATTLVTNTILERKGAKTGLLTTAGFRDILELHREVRYDIFDMFIKLPRPLVPRHLRLEVPERILSDGSVRVALDAAAVVAAAAQFRAQGVEAVAIAFLHSYRNPSHEQRAAEILRRELSGIEISLSCLVNPEPKEYERTSTAVTDAYVKRVVTTYLDNLQEGLEQRGFLRKLFVMLSNGGTARIEAARNVPVQLVESGPAAGVEAAAFFGRLLGIKRLLSFDMGGTTAKLCLIENGRAARAREFEVDRVHRFRKGSGLPVMVPVYDLLEIGAGGGSIARINDLGLLQIGPDSAGSEPGPACYGRGGNDPTVTDADLVLGLLDADSFLGGAMRLDRPASVAAVSERLGAKAGLSAERAAAGIHELVNETMASAARMYLAEKGTAPSEVVMVAFGGAGPVHAVGLARKLGCRTVVIPPLPGVMSSLGLLVAPVAFERVRSMKMPLATISLAEVERGFAELEAEARANFAPEAQPQPRRMVDIRYHGQDHALEIETPSGKLDDTVRARWCEGFVSAYRALYGKIDSDNPIEVAALRVVLEEFTPPPPMRRPSGTTPAMPQGWRKLWSAERGALVEAPVYARGALTIGQEIVGPAIVEERESTTVIGALDRMTVDQIGCLVITLGGLRDAAMMRSDELVVSR
jgi:N-methylhydantoinase A/oxoprolinase/acetone carboxylase beta subunit